MERIRRRGQVAYDAQALALAAGVPCVHPFKPDVLWDWCFTELIAMTDFWKEAYTDGALLILAKIRTESSMLEDDAPTESQASGSRSVASRTPPQRQQQQTRPQG